MAVLVPRGRVARAAALLVVLVAALFLLGQQGTRLGGWRLPGAVPPWVWLLLPAVMLGVPAERPPTGARRALGAGLVLVLVAGPLFAWRQRVALPPVAVSAVVWSASRPAERPQRVLIPDLARLRSAPPWHHLLGRNQDFVLDLQAWLWVPRTTTYRLELQADDQATLAVDGNVVLGAVSAARVDLPLAGGVHALVVRHEQGVGAARVALDWDRPPFVELLPIEAYLAGRPEGLAAPVLWRRHAATLLSLILAALWWLAAGGVLVRLGEVRRASPLLVRLQDQALAWARASWRDQDHRVGTLVFAGGALFLLGLEAASRSHAIDGQYFQEYTSEYLMQTVSVADLRDQPWRSLFYLHIQPPALDALRALLARLHPQAPARLLLRGVDADLYLVWAAVYSGLLALLWRWTCALTSRRFALGVAVFLGLHPALLFYATLLDSTLLSAALFAWFCFEQWRFSVQRGSVPRLAAAAIALFLTRSVFQWPFLLVLAVGLLLLRVPWRRTARVILPVAAVMALYMGKQYALFGVTMTSTFAANSFCRGLGVYCLGTTPVERPRLPPARSALVLSRTAKIDGQYNYNQLAFLERSFAQMAEYRATLRRQPWPVTLGVWRENLGVYLRPSSRYTAHALVDRLPWRAAYDAVLSGWSLVLLVALAALLGALEAGPRRALALALPAAYVMAVTVLFEGGEHMRYKFFIEPVLLVLVATQAYRLLARALALAVPREAPVASA